MIQYFEKVEMTKTDTLDLPESIFLRPSLTLVFDNVNDKLFITKIVSPSKLNAKSAFNKAKNEINKLINSINKPLNNKNLNLHNLNQKVNIFKMLNQIQLFLNLEKWLKKQKKIYI